ncbi:hypothetical protein GGR28_003553 [Lewinella aquimaris]|uniref:ASPIC/UnbV domain-containing protein n=1 Tax=Neolewinella aquimaris TaxID=1835722 RepID=A0A840E5J2_9BACT|nr:FG-GAP-like repeat-containing protein [Neolewinella aquimaris]MBB4080914.1 hypothetical protein [Neolewinella aquimaris]
MRLLISFCCLCIGWSLRGQEPFRDATRDAGIEVVARVRGVSVCDPNGDGHPDLFLSVLDGPNRLFQNDGRAHFTEVGHRTPLATAGPTQTTLWADLDQDGDQDVVLGNRDVPSRIFRNDGTTFTDVTPGSGIELDARIQSGVLLDFDGDGRPDIYFTCLGSPNRLYRNLGNLTFVEVGGAAGAAQSGLSMGSLAFDYDLDGDPDLYLVRDGLQTNVLLRNDGGTFTDVSEASGAGVVGDGMGVDAADYDLDGDFDLYITNLYENFLLENQGDGTFREVGFGSRTNDLGMGWGTAFLDFDNDGLPDLYVANETGFTIGGERFNNVLYRNVGDGTFIPAALPTAAINSARSAYGTATADFNGDGLPDLFVGNSGQGSQLFLNATDAGNHWLAVSVVAEVGEPTALGTRITCWVGSQAYVAEVRAGGSFASQHNGTVHFGLGSAARVDSLVLDWPSGRRDRYYDLAADRKYRLPATAGKTTSLPVAFRPSVGVYPNPTSGRLNFTVPLRDVRVYSATGQLINTQAGEHAHFDLPEGTAPGIYHLVGFRGMHPIVLTISYRFP